VGFYHRVGRPDEVGGLLGGQHTFTPQVADLLTHAWSWLTAWL